MENEIWLPIKDFESRYLISNMGRIKRLSFEVPNGRGGKNSTRKEKILKDSVSKMGYCRVDLRLNYKSRRSFVHRIVVESFLGIPSSLMYTNHKNGIKTDNRLENLEWVTSKENTAHAIETGLITNLREGHYAARINWLDVADIREKYSRGDTLTQLGVEYKMTKQNIFRIVNNKTWKHI